MRFEIERRGEQNSIAAKCVHLYGYRFKVRRIAARPNPARVIKDKTLTDPAFQDFIDYTMEHGIPAAPAYFAVAVSRFPPASVKPTPGIRFRCDPLADAFG